MKAKNKTTKMAATDIFFTSISQPFFIIIPAQGAISDHF